jgi:hypothetical protein
MQHEEGMFNFVWCPVILILFMGIFMCNFVGMGFMRRVVCVWVVLVFVVGFRFGFLL